SPDAVTGCIACMRSIAVCTRARGECSDRGPKRCAPPERTTTAPWTPRVSARSRAGAEPASARPAERRVGSLGALHAPLALATSPVAFLLEPALHRRRCRPRRVARLGPATAPAKLGPHPLERELAIPRLRAALGGDAGDAGRPVTHTHTRLGLVLLLPAWP